MVYKNHVEEKEEKSLFSGEKVSEDTHFYKEMREREMNKINERKREHSGKKA